jgi:cyanate permease
LVLGMCTAAGSLGAFIYPPIVTALISSIGWRMSWLVLAGIVLIVGVLIGGVILIRNRPEDMGQVPEGASSESLVGAEMTENQSGTGERQVKWQMKEVLRMPITWIIVIFSVASNFILGTMSAHQIAYLQDLGFGAMTAAATLSLLAAMSIVGSLGFGFLALRFNIRYLAGAGFVIVLVALGILLTTRELALLYVYSALLGIGLGGPLAALPTLVGVYFGRDRYAQVMGIVFPFHVVAMAAAASIAGAIYDATGAYTMAFVTAAVFGVIGFVSALMARKPKQS